MRIWFCLCALVATIFTIYACIAYNIFAGIYAGGLIFIVMFAIVPSIFAPTSNLGIISGLGGVLAGIAWLVGGPLVLFLVEFYVVDNGVGGAKMDPVTLNITYEKGANGKEIGKDYQGDKVMQAIGDFTGGFLALLQKIPATFIPNCGFARAAFFWVCVIFAVAFGIWIFKQNQGNE